MPSSPPVGAFPLRPPPGLNDAQLREWLAVACELDRVRFQLAGRPSPTPSVSFSILQNVIPLAPHLPGKLGRWFRRIRQGTNLLRGVYETMGL
jgi:hypothetical protein